MGQPVTLTPDALDHRARGAASAASTRRRSSREIGYDREALSRMKAAGVY